MRLQILLSISLCVVGISSTVIKRNDLELANLQNALTVISTDIQNLDSSIKVANTISNVTVAINNISKLNHTIGLCNTLLGSTLPVSADLALTLQKFGSELVVQVLTTLNDLIKSKSVFASVPNGQQAVLMNLLAVQSTGQTFVNDFQTKVPATVWTSVAVPDVTKVMAGLNATIKVFGG